MPNPNNSNTDNWENGIRDRWNAMADSAWYKSLRTDAQLEALRRDPATAFHPAVFDIIKKHLVNIEGKRVLLPSSGDNHAAFAFAMLGAKVTSADISERQLENAQSIARRLGLDIQFVCDNTMQLARIDDDSYDLVYTSNGTLTWIYDLNSMYENISRVLKKQGLSIMYDIHPFNRPFSGEAWKDARIVKSYYDVLPSLHWRVQDIVNANISAKLTLIDMAELPAVDASFWYTYDELKTKSPEELIGINDWRNNAMAALPAWLVLVSRKA